MIATGSRWTQRARWLRRAVRTVVLLAVLALCAIGVVAVGTGNWQIRPILSGSMRPHFPIGGVLVTERVPTSSLRVGDVAVFHPPDDPAITYMHRIVWLEHKGGSLLIRTKGDANPTVDPWTLRVKSPVSYEARYVLPYVGYAAVWVHSPGGRRDLVILAAGSFAVCIAALVFAGRGRLRRRRAEGKRGLSGISAPTARGLGRRPPAGLASPWRGFADRADLHRLNDP